MTAMSGLKTFAFVTDAPVAPLVVAGSTAGAGGGGRAARRRALRLALPLHGGEPRFERRKTSVELLLEIVDCLADRLGVCRRLRGLRRHLRRNYHRAGQRKHGTTKLKHHALTSRSLRAGGWLP